MFLLLDGLLLHLLPLHTRATRQPGQPVLLNFAAAGVTKTIKCCTSRLGLLCMQRNTSLFIRVDTRQGLLLGIWLHFTVYIWPAFR